MRRKISVFIGVMILCVHLNTAGQASVKDSVISMFSIDLNLGYHRPAGDMVERFGSNGALGGGIHFKTDRNWEWGLEAQFIFGRRVNEAVTESIVSSDGFHIDQNGGYVNLLFLERGMTAMGTLAKVIPLLGPNPNSGLMIKGGLGLLQHKILLESRLNDVPQLDGDYLKGYDRLTNGLCLHQFIGYKYMGNSRYVNITLGLEGYQAFTQSRRDFDFDTMKKDDKQRIDMLYGVKLIWSFPIYRRASTGYYIN